MQETLEQFVEVRPKKKQGFAVRPEFINRKGHPANPVKRQLLQALKEAAKENGNIDFLYHVAREAYKNNQVMLAVLDKLVPDEALKKDFEGLDRANELRVLIINHGDDVQGREKRVSYDRIDVQGQARVSLEQQGAVSAA